MSMEYLLRLIKTSAFFFLTQKNKLQKKKKKATTYFKIYLFSFTKFFKMSTRLLGVPFSCSLLKVKVKFLDIRF